MRYFIYILLLLSGSSMLHAQTATVSFERNKILLGEQARIHVTLQGINSYKTDLSSWFSIANTTNHIEIIKRDAIDSIKTDSSIVYSQNIYITSFDSGRWQLQFTPATVKNKSTSKTTSVNISNAFIEVLPVDVSTLENYHDIKDIISVEEENKSTLWQWLSILIIAVITVWLFFFRKKKNKNQILTPQEKGNALKDALKNLDLLKKEKILSEEEVKVYYTKLSNICYSYIYSTTDIDAIHATNDAWINKISFTPETKTRFFQLVRLWNAVKFAKYIPDESQHIKSVEEAKECLKQVSSE